MKIGENSKKPSYPFFAEKSSSELTYEDCDISVYRYIKDHNDPSDVAVYFQGKEYTYKYLFDLADEIADRLWACGVRPSDLILTMVEANPIITAFTLALSKIGACMFSFTLQTPEDYVEKIMSVSDVRLFFVMENHYVDYGSVSALDDLDNVIIIPPDMEGKEKSRTGAFSNIINWSEFMKGKKSKAPEIKGGSYPLNIMSTSGSTGRPKGMVLTNSNHIALIRIYRDIPGFFQKGDSFYTMLPAFVATGISLCIIVPLAMGVRVIEDTVQTLETLVRNIEKYHPNILLAPKSSWLALREIAPEIDLSFLNNPLTCGEPIYDNEMDTLRTYLLKNGCKRIPDNIYGMSECNSAMTGSLGKVKKVTTSAGFSLPHVCISAFDVAGDTERDYNQLGEICIYSPSNMRKYYLNAKATKEFFFEDCEGRLWARSGDVGYVCENGEIVICCRLKEQFTDEKGVSIYPYEVDRRICSVNGIARSKTLKCVIDGKPVLAVHFIPASDNADVSELIKDMKDVCGDLPVRPTAFKAYTSFPLNKGGKIDMVGMSADTDGLMIQ